MTILTLDGFKNNSDLVNDGPIVKAMKVDVFQTYIDDLDLSIKPIDSNSDMNVLDINSIYVQDVYGRNRFFVGIQKINKLKTIFSPLMNESHINKLIQFLSAAQFYSKLLHHDFCNDFIKFIHCDLFNLSKVELLHSRKYLEFSIGIFEVKVGKSIKVENYIDDYERSFSTIDDAYCYLLDYIQQNICEYLEIDKQSVSNKDIVLLHMITC